MTDETTLLQQAKMCDPVALGELYDRYAPRMYGYIYRRLGDAALAEDLTSELFLRVLRAIQSDHAWRDSFRAWLYRIAHNLVVDYCRQQQPLPVLSLDEELLASGRDDPKIEVENDQTYMQLRSAVGQLTPEQQEILALRFGEGLKTREVAKIVRKTTGAVQALQHRALASLRRILKETSK